MVSLLTLSIKYYKVGESQLIGNRLGNCESGKSIWEEKNFSFLLFEAAKIHKTNEEDWLNEYKKIT